MTKEVLKDWKDHAQSKEDSFRITIEHLKDKNDE